MELGKSQSSRFASQIVATIGAASLRLMPVFPFILPAQRVSSTPPVSTLRSSELRPRAPRCRSIASMQATRTECRQTSMPTVAPMVSAAAVGSAPLRSSCTTSACVLSAASAARRASRSVFARCSVASCARDRACNELGVAPPSAAACASSTSSAGSTEAVASMRGATQLATGFQLLASHLTGLFAVAATIRTAEKNTGEAPLFKKGRIVFGWKLMVGFEREFSSMRESFCSSPGSAGQRQPFSRSRSLAAPVYVARPPICPALCTHTSQRPESSPTAQSSGRAALLSAIIRPEQGRRRRPFVWITA